MSDNIKGGATIVVDDAHMAANPVLIGEKSEDNKLVADNVKNVPHSLDSVVTTSTLQKKLKCPRCGKSTLRVEFPDQYEAWTKCSSCGFFMGMSNDEWHLMVNSPNINEKIKRMSNKKELR